MKFKFVLLGVSCGSGDIDIVRCTSGGALVIFWEFGVSFILFYISEGRPGRIRCWYCFDYYAFLLVRVQRETFEDVHPEVKGWSYLGDYY